MRASVMQRGIRCERRRRTDACTRSGSPRKCSAADTYPHDHCWRSWKNATQISNDRASYPRPQRHLFTEPPDEPRVGRAIAEALVEHESPVAAVLEDHGELPGRQIDEIAGLVHVLAYAGVRQPDRRVLPRPLILDLAPRVDCEPRRALCAERGAVQQAEAAAEIDLRRQLRLPRLRRRARGLGWAAHKGDGKRRQLFRRLHPHPARARSAEAV